MPGGSKEAKIGLSSWSGASRFSLPNRRQTGVKAVWYVKAVLADQWLFWDTNPFL